MGGDARAVAATLGGAPAPRTAAVRQVEHPAVVGLAHTQIASLDAGENADRIGGDEPQHRTERMGTASGTRQAGAGRGQAWDAARNDAVHALDRARGRTLACGDAPEQLVEVLAQAPNAREVLVGQHAARLEPDTDKPIAQSCRRAQPLDRPSVSTADR